MYMYVHRAIEKICTIHSHFGTLIRLALSYSKAIHVNWTQPHHYTGETWCPHKQAANAIDRNWVARYCKIYSTDKSSSLRDTPEEARANEKTIFSKAIAWQGLLENCECSLVAYILHSPPPISHIGLQAVGTVTHCNFGTNGCRDKWYPCLVTPALANNES